MVLKRQETWNITYTHALGETASWFYVQLRDHAKLYGKRDAKSGRVLVPPRAFSDQTLEPTTDWVEVGPGGRIETFSIVYEEFNGLPPPPVRVRLRDAGRRGHGDRRLLQGRRPDRPEGRGER